MSKTPFHLIDPSREGTTATPEQLADRSFVSGAASFVADARRFVPGEELALALNTALAVGEPLLITGEPGTGKTQTAYYAAHKLGIEPVLHFQVKSDSAASDLLYSFDAVGYFRDAQVRPAEEEAPSKADYVEPRPLWEAFTSDTPRVVLIDEIDKAPRDFPNDLLHELDRMEFTVKETGDTVAAPAERRPVVIITSNSERRLPEPFLRRCVYHHIHFDTELLAQAVASHAEAFERLSDDFVDLAIRRFLALRNRDLRKKPATSELLVWLRVLARAAGTYPERLDDDLSNLPFLSALLKDHKDREEL